MGFIPPRILNINPRYTADFQSVSFIGPNSTQLVLIVNKLITSNLFSVGALRNTEQAKLGWCKTRFISFHPPWVFFFLPELNNSQNTLVRFCIVSNAEEVQPPAMSE